MHIMYSDNGKQRQSGTFNGFIDRCYWSAGPLELIIRSPKNTTIGDIIH